MKCDYQQEEAAKKSAIHLSKINDKRNNVERTMNKISMQEQENFAKTTGVLLRKANAMDTHDKISHL
jgi:hypothetical protein